VDFDRPAEARLRWKIDLYITPTVSLLYLFCFIDRASIARCCPRKEEEDFGLQCLMTGNARLAGLEVDLHLEGTTTTGFPPFSILATSSSKSLPRWPVNGSALGGTSQLSLSDSVSALSALLL
jgi:hypothetical protein